MVSFLPGGDATCTGAYASLCRTGEALLGEPDRHIAATFGITQAAATALAVIDGAPERLHGQRNRPARLTPPQDTGRGSRG